MDSKAGREELVHSVFANVGFWDRKTKYKLLRGSFSKLCGRYTGGVDSRQTRQCLIYWKYQLKDLPFHQTPMCLKSL